MNNKAILFLSLIFCLGVIIPAVVVLDGPSSTVVIGEPSTGTVKACVKTSTGTLVCP